jgi:hypothetical protein
VRQGHIEAGGDEAVIDGGEPCRLLGVMMTHVMRCALRV